MREKLIEMIRRLSYKKGEFTLASGKKSDFYVDMRNTLLHPEGAKCVATLMSQKLKHLDGELVGVGGMTMGADPIATALSIETLSWDRPLMAFYIRKEPKDHGTQQFVEGLINFKSGDKVYILEDSATTGGSSLKAAERAQEAGLDVLGIFTCVDRQEGAKERVEGAGFEFLTLVTKADILQ